MWKAHSLETDATAELTNWGPFWGPFSCTELSHVQRFIVETGRGTIWVYTNEHSPNQFQSMVQGLAEARNCS